MIVNVSIQGGRMRIQPAGSARWFGTSLDIPVAHLVSVKAADRGDVQGWNKGIRLAGVQLPGVMVLGTYRRNGQLTWWGVGRGGNAIEITLRDERVARAVVAVDDPSAVMRELERAIEQAASS